MLQLESDGQDNPYSRLMALKRMGAAAAVWEIR